MYDVNSIHVDWGEEWENWNTQCPFCEGEGQDENGEYCEHCEDGYLAMYWNTAWEIGLHDVSKDTIKDITANTNCLVVYSHKHDGYYLTLGGCGMDLTPSLCDAWIRLGFGWLPLDWIDRLSRNGDDYNGYVVGRDRLPEIYKAARATIEGARRNLDRMTESFLED